MGKVWVHLDKGLSIEAASDKVDNGPNGVVVDTGSPYVAMYPWHRVACIEIEKSGDSND